MANFNADEVLVPLFSKAIPIGQGCGMPDSLVDGHA